MKAVQAAEAGARQIETKFSNVMPAPLQWGGRRITLHKEELP
jgi:hypothetical protein